MRIFMLVWLLLAATPLRAERMVVERVVPPGATLTYSEGGSPVRTVDVPAGRVRVIIEYGGAIAPRHGRRR